MISIWLMVILLSFSPLDSSWSYISCDDIIYNIGGILGAWIADILLFVFGITAYTLPIIIVGVFCFIWYQYKVYKNFNFSDLFLRFIGLLKLIFASCGIATINIDDIWYYSSGGIVGILIKNLNFIPNKDIIYTFFLVFIWIIGFSFSFKLSWIKIIKNINVFYQKNSIYFNKK